MTLYRYPSDRALVRTNYRYVYLVMYRQLAISFYYFVHLRGKTGEVKQRLIAHNFPGRYPRELRVSSSFVSLEFYPNQLLINLSGFSRFRILSFLRWDGSVCRRHRLIRIVTPLLRPLLLRLRVKCSSHSVITRDQIIRSFPPIFLRFFSASFPFEE